VLWHVVVKRKQFHYGNQERCGTFQLFIFISPSILIKVKEFGRAMGVKAQIKVLAFDFVRMQGKRETCQDMTELKQLILNTEYIQLVSYLD
jgi:hypothetical protein